MERALNLLSELLEQVQKYFTELQVRSVSPADGYLKYDYLIPAGYYHELWDWDGFFIGVEPTGQD